MPGSTPGCCRRGVPLRGGGGGGMEARGPPLPARRRRRGEPAGRRRPPAAIWARGGEGRQAGAARPGGRAAPGAGCPPVGAAPTPGRSRGYSRSGRAAPLPVQAGGVGGGGRGPPHSPPAPPPGPTSPAAGSALRLSKPRPMGPAAARWAPLLPRAGGRGEGEMLPTGERLLQWVSALPAGLHALQQDPRPPRSVSGVAGVGLGCRKVKNHLPDPGDRNAQQHSLQPL